MNGTNTLELKDCHTFAALDADARRHKRMGRVGILTELLLQEIVEMAGEEASDALKARLIQVGVNVGQAMRTVLD